MRIAGPENAIHCRQKPALGEGTATVPCTSASESGAVEGGAAVDSSPAGRGPESDAGLESIIYFIISTITKDYVA